MEDERRVNEIMTRQVVTLREEDNLEGLADSMDKLQYRYLPVVDDTRFVGLLTYRNLMRPEGRVSRPPNPDDPQGVRWERSSFVADVMARAVPTLPPDALAGDAARLLMRHGVPCVPILDEDESLVGIVTRDDLLRLTIELLEGANRAGWS